MRAHDRAQEPLLMLAIGQLDTPGQNPLPAVHKEIATIRRACARVSHTPTTMIGPPATVHAVYSALPAHTWLRFACHAHQDPSYAFASAFFMHDGPLRLGTPMRLNLSRTQFAFLSACLASAGDERLPDKSIHLAAGLQFACARCSPRCGRWMTGQQPSWRIGRMDICCEKASRSQIHWRRRRRCTGQ